MPDVSPLLTVLEQILEHGACCMGEVRFSRDAQSYVLRHYLDGDAADLEFFHKPDAALELAKFDAAGGYRALKSAPNLRRGWEIQLGHINELRQALDFFYPAMLGSWTAWQRAQLPVTDLRATLNRQSGMYRVANKITDEQADALIARVCAPEKCLKTILWRIDENRSIDALATAKFDPACDLLARPSPFTPLLCQEACNLFVAAAREVVKSPSPTAP